MEKNKLKKSPQCVRNVKNTHNSPTHNYIVYKGVEYTAQQPIRGGLAPATSRRK